MILVAPSLLSADFANLQNEIEWLNTSAADWYHIDIMDGQFVPNISMGLPIVKSIKKHATKPLDVHVMMLQPERYIDDFIAAGADVLTLHYEAVMHLDAALTSIRKQGAKAGVALNPSTSVAVLEPILHLCDVVCLMSVNPGFGGQLFIEYTIDKIKQLKQLIVQKNVTTLIEVDGGVTIENAKKIIHAGASILVAGNTVFTSDQPAETILKLKNL